MFITNTTMDAPFEEMHRMGWGAALVVAFAILSLNVAVRALAHERKRFCEKSERRGVVWCSL